MTDAYILLFLHIFQKPYWSRIAHKITTRYITQVYIPHNQETRLQTPISFEWGNTYLKSVALSMEPIWKWRVRQELFGKRRGQWGCRESHTKWRNTETNYARLEHSLKGFKVHGSKYIGRTRHLLEIWWWKRKNKEVGVN